MLVQTLATAALFAALAPTPVVAQQLTNDGCLFITGSKTCPGFQQSYVNVQQLASNYSFFNNVYDVSDFDKYVGRYFSTASQYPKTKFTQGLGCSNASTAVIRYQQTVMCSIWVNDPTSIQCMQDYRELSKTRASRA